MTRPAHDPAGFLWLIGTAFNGILYEPLRAAAITLPPVFDGVEPGPTEPAPRAARRAPPAMPMAISPDTSTTAN